MAHRRRADDARLGTAARSRRSRAADLFGRTPLRYPSRYVFKTATSNRETHDPARADGFHGAVPATHFACRLRAGANVWLAASAGQDAVQPRAGTA
jgi:hypothetical protein